MNEYMNEYMNENMNENITFFLEEDYKKENTTLDILTLQSELNDDIFQELYNYELNYTIKQLSIICDFYKIKLNNKIKKQDIISYIIAFEKNIENIECVIRRKELWNYLNELKNDKTMKKFVIW